MAKLSTEARKKLPAKDFALGKGRYPIEDKAHARNALARAAQHASPKEQAEIRRKVHAKFPDIGKGGKKGANHNGPHAHMGRDGMHYGAHDGHAAIGEHEGREVCR